MYFNFRGGGVNFRLQAPDQVPVSTLCLSVIYLEAVTFRNLVVTIGCAYKFKANLQR